MSRYEFGEFCLDPGKRQLFRQGNPVSLTPKALDTLLLLIQNKGEIVSKETLLKEIWPDAFVEEATLSQNIFTVRRALGQRQDGGQFIETVSKRGYRFVAPIREALDSEEAVLEKHTPTETISEEFEADFEDLTSEKPPIWNIKTVHKESSIARVKLTRSAASRRSILVLSLFLVLGVVAGIGLKVKSLRGSKQPGVPFQPASVRKLTNSGDVSRAVLSPDGTYVLYSAKKGGQESLWLQQVGSAREIQIVPPAVASYRGIRFAPDGTSIYYSRYDKTNIIATLFRSSVLGGAPSPVLSDIDSAVAFSPDGKRICFFRNLPDQSSPYGFSTALMGANIDGSGQYAMASYRSIFAGEGPAWSPDGKTIAFPIAQDDLNPNRSDLIALNVETGTKTLLSSGRWKSIGQISWATEGDALLFDGWDESMPSPQLWELSYPSGKIRRLTNDLNSYNGASFGSNALVTTQSVRLAKFWLATAADGGDATPITTGAGDERGELMGVSWTLDGHIVYGSTQSGNPDVWFMNADGSNRTQLTIDSKSNLLPSSLRDGSIVFVSRRTGRLHLWIMDADGSNQRQLSHNDNEEMFPSVFPDGKSVAFVRLEPGWLPKVWKLSLESKQEVLLSTHYASRPVVSPDGRFVACLFQESTTPASNIAILPATGGNPTKNFELPLDVATVAGIRWTSDGRAIAFVRNIDGVSNVWIQPIDNGAAKPLTHFTSENVFRFAWSQDGRKLAIERGVDVQDAVILRRAN